MLRTVNALARALGFVWLGLLAFLIAPPSAPYAVPVQIACYAVLGLALLAWTVLEASPAAAARYPAWALPVAPRGDRLRLGVRGRRWRRRFGHGGLRVRGGDGRGR